MSFVFGNVIGLGSNNAGLTLLAQLYNTSGAAVGGEITSGFLEIGRGFYYWYYTSFPDSFRGFVKFYTATINPIVVHAINTEEGEAVATLITRLPSALTITSGKVDVNDKTGFVLSSGGNQAMWDTATADQLTVGSLGKLFKDYIDAAISSRLATGSYTAPDNTSITAIKAKTDNLPASPAAVGSAMALTSGERTTLSAVFWDSLTSGFITAGSAGKRLVDYLTGDTYARLGAPAGASVSVDIAAVKSQADAVKAKTDTLPGSPAAVGSAMTLTSGERDTLTGVIWAALTSGLSTVGSVGKLLVDNINATIGSRSTYAGADTAGTTTLLSRIASALTITSGKVDVNDKTGFSLSATGLNAVSAPSDITTDAQARGSFMGMIKSLHARFYNKVTQTVTAQIVYNDSNAAVSTKISSDDNVTQTLSKSV